MIASQRKAHKFIWLGLTGLISILLVIVISGLKFSSTSGETPQIPLETELTKDNTVLIRLNEPLKTPSALVYEIDAKEELGAVLGELSEKGAYKFTLSKDAAGITIVDNIKNQKIYTTTF